MRQVVLYRSDTEPLAVLRRRVADRMPKRMGEVGLIGVQIKIVFAEGLLYAQDFEQIVRREAGQPFERALQLPR